MKKILINDSQLRTMGNPSHNSEHSLSPLTPLHVYDSISGLL